MEKEHDKLSKNEVFTMGIQLVGTSLSEIKCVIVILQNQINST